MPRKNEQKTLIQNIIIRPVQRTMQDISTWRNAMKAAEAVGNPSRIRLYDLYSDLVLDATLSSLIEKRILNITRTKLRYYNAKGEEVTDMSYLIDSFQFDELRKEIAMQKFWGKSLCELSRLDDRFAFYNIPRKHIRPDLGKIVWEQLGTEGVEYRKPPYSRTVIEVGGDYDLGLLLKAAPYVLYKRGGFGDWAKFAEVFGMPFREFRYDGFNKEVRAELEAAAEDYGAAAYAILPKEAEFNLHETHNTQGGGRLYDDLRKACNQELSILILGQTETTMSSQSSGYAQSKTHARTEDDINENDRLTELAILNEKVAPVLKNLGYPITEGGYFEHELKEPELNKEDEADVIIKIKEAFNLPVDDDYLYEHFNVPKPKDYEQRKREQDAKEEEPGEEENGPGDEEVKLSKKAWKKLADFFGGAPGK